jgi:hypothetical protein
MSTLNKEQTELIRKELSRRSLSRSFLFSEYLDHVCCDVEDLMNTGMNFQDAWTAVRKAISDKEIRQADARTISLLNHRYVLAKKILMLAVILFAVSWLVWVPAAAAWTGLAAFLLLSLVFVRISIDLFRERRRHRIGWVLAAAALLSFIGTLTGSILIFLQRNFAVNTHGHGIDLTVFAWFFFSLLCLVYYARQSGHSIEVRIKKRNTFLVWVSALNLLLASVSLATFPLYQRANDFIFYLITVILAVDIIVMIIYLAGKYMKNTLAVSLVFASFMIVFIHSGFRQNLPGGKPQMYRYTVTIFTENPQSSEKLYLYMYYDKYNEYKFVLPMQRSVIGSYTNSIPSYAFKGYLIYTVRPDSTDARELFSQEGITVDSLKLNIPKIKDYFISLKSDI